MIYDPQHAESRTSPTSLSDKSELNTYPFIHRSNLRLATDLGTIQGYSK